MKATVHGDVLVGEEMVTPGVTVKIDPLVPLDSSGFVTEIVPAPVGAVGETETVITNCVALSETIVGLTVMPLFENDASTPETNPVPLIVTVWLEKP